MTWGTCGHYKTDESQIQLSNGFTKVNEHEK